MEIKIVDVITPSEKQKSAGIFGTVNMELRDDKNQVIVRLSGLAVRKSKNNDEYFLSEPSYPVGQGQDTKWYKHFTMFPDSFAGDATAVAAKNALISQVMKSLSTGGTRREKDDNKSFSAPKAAGKPVHNDPWR